MIFLWIAGDRKRLVSFETIKSTQTLNATSLMRTKQSRSNLNSIIKKCFHETRIYLYHNKQKQYSTFILVLLLIYHKRIEEHKQKRYENSFSARYNLNKLVYYEQFQMIGDAIGRENN